MCLAVNAVCAWAELGMSVFPILSPAQALEVLLSTMFPEWAPGTHCSVSPVLPLARLAGWTSEPCCRLAFSFNYGIIFSAPVWAPYCVWHSWWTLSLTPGSTRSSSMRPLWDCASWMIVRVVLGLPWAFFCLQQPLLFLALHLQSFAYSLSAALSEFAHISSRIAWANYILATPTGSLKCKLAIWVPLTSHCMQHSLWRFAGDLPISLNLEQYGLGLLPLLNMEDGTFPFSSDFLSLQCFSL